MSWVLSLALVAGLLSYAALRSWDCQVLDHEVGAPVLPAGAGPIKGVTLSEPYYRQGHGWECARKRLRGDL